MATIGIDVGNNLSVMAVVGRGNVEIVRNDISERLTPSLVGFSDGERLLGDPALTLFKSNYRNTCRNMKNLLGRTFDAPIEWEQRYSYVPLVPAEGDLVGYQVKYQDRQTVISATAAVAAFLTGLKDTAERSLQQKVNEVVIGVPSWFTDRSCQAMMDAAALAGIRCLRVLSEHAATALDYGIYRSSDFDANEPHRVLFVDVGYCSTAVFIVDFVKNELRVVHVEADQNLGGRNMDAAISECVASDISRRLKCNLLDNLKARMKIEDAAIKAKKILSANTEAAVALESIYDDEDIDTVITREQFNELCEPLRQKLYTLLTNAFRQNGGAAINSIELVGGCTRIPWVQECIIEAATAAGLRAADDDDNTALLSRTLNQDECVAKGCALQAAMLSPRFKVREFNVNDIIVHPVVFSWDARCVDGGSSGHNANSDSSDWRYQEVIPAGSQYPVNKWITFEPCSTLRCRLSYADANRLPTSVSESIGCYTITLPHTSKSKNAKVKVNLSVDINRICNVQAHLSEEELVEVTVQEKRLIATKSEGTAATTATTPPQTNGTPTSPTDPTADADMSAEQQLPSSPHTPSASQSRKDTEKYEYVPVTKSEWRTKQTVMQVNVDDRSGWLTPPLVKDLHDRELAMMTDDRMHIDRKNKLNDMETYAYNMRDAVECGVLGKFFEPNVKVSFLDALNRASDWIYEEGRYAQKSEIAAKLDELKAVSDRAVNLMKEQETREEAVAQLLDECRNIRMMAAGNDPQFDHIDIAVKTDIINHAVELENWINTQIAAQSSRPLFADPLLTSAQILEEMNKFSSQSRAHLFAPKPATPPQDAPPAPGL